MTAWAKVKGLGFAALASGLALTAGMASAQYEVVIDPYKNALDAYLDAKMSDGRIDADKVSGALDIWQKSALAGDVRSAKILGDAYSNRDLVVTSGEDLKPADTLVIPIDAVEALAWYIIAATHDFDDYAQSNPAPEAVNARTLARLAIPDLKKNMSDAAVRRAEARAIDLLAAGSRFDLYRLGKMHAQGNGVTKDNVEAVKFLLVAMGNGRGAIGDAKTLHDNLKTLMAESDYQAAVKRAEEWRPPAPQTLALLTERDRSDALRLTELQYAELSSSLKQLEAEFEDNPKVIQRALRALGFYWDDRIDGKLNSRASSEAIKRFQKSLIVDRFASAENGNALSEDEEAMIEAVEDQATGILTDLQKVELMKRAAMKDHPPSMHIYGVMLGRGIGVRKNGQEAIDMLTRAAEEDYALAHYSAGTFYVEGITAVEPLQQSVSEACYHFSSAAVLGYARAQKALEEHCGLDFD